MTFPGEIYAPPNGMTMQTTVYLCVIVDTSGDFPVVVGIATPSESPMTITSSMTRRYASLLEISGENYGDAKDKMREFVQKWPHMFGWAQPWLEDGREAHQRQGEILENALTERPRTQERWSDEIEVLRRRAEGGDFEAARELLREARIRKDKELLDEIEKLTLETRKRWHGLFSEVMEEWPKVDPDEQTRPDEDMGRGPNSPDQPG
jgi:hypothetical protein